MRVKELFPKPDHVQSLYCPTCSGPMELVFGTFDEDVEGIRLVIENIPLLQCDNCDMHYLPDRSREALITLHFEAWKVGRKEVRVKRQKREDDLWQTEVPFIYDPDDYYYIPGLIRPQCDGFLTPVFFKKSVLIRFDNSPDYVVRFASRTYGQIYQGEEHSICFGINKHDKVIMWLGDIAILPKEVQYALRADNVQSDHCVGSEFYDGQIEAVFTERTPEEDLIEARARFHHTAVQCFEKRLSQLNQEALQLIDQLKSPITFSEKDTKHAVDVLYKLNVEALDSKNLGALIQEKAQSAEKLGTLKRLEKLLSQQYPDEPIATIMAPFFSLNDLRVAFLHLQSHESRRRRLQLVRQVLNLETDAPFSAIYSTMVAKITESYNRLREIIERHME